MKSFRTKYSKLSKNLKPFISSKKLREHNENFVTIDSIKIFEIFKKSESFGPLGKIDTFEYSNKH